MKSIVKLAMVVLLLVASYKMYGQSNCQPQIMACEEDCMECLSMCQYYCDLDYTPNTFPWNTCMTYCDEAMQECSNVCQSSYCTN